MGKPYKLYVLINLDTPIYVGVTCNITQRCRKHKALGKVFTRHVILEQFKEKKDAYTAERAIIKYLSAFGNKENVNGKYEHIEWAEISQRAWSNGTTPTT
jgi:predicted GIY-YIG superfamily endonuclease